MTIGFYDPAYIGKRARTYYVPALVSDDDLCVQSKNVESNVYALDSARIQILLGLR